jgi:chromosome segregation ATPase
MKTIIKALFITVIAFSFSCKEEQSKDSKAFDAQMKETVQIHDDVMPKMTELNSLISKLEKEKEKIEASGDVASEEVETYETAINDLKEAHDLMMSWMKNFSNSFSRTEINTGLATKDKDSIKAKQEMLSAQYNSAEEMQTAITKAIENAQLLLSE